MGEDYPYLYTQTQHGGRGQKNARLPISAWKEAVYFPSCCLWFWLPVSLHVEAHWDPFVSLVKLVGMFPAISPSSK